VRSIAIGRIAIDRDPIAIRLRPITISLSTVRLIAIDNDPIADPADCDRTGNDRQRSADNDQIADPIADLIAICSIAIGRIVGSCN